MEDPVDIKQSGVRYRMVVEALLRQRRDLQQPLKLAAETELAEQFGVARTTVRRALQILESQGVVTRRRGRGTFLHPSRRPIRHMRGAVVGFIPPWWADSTQAYYTSSVFDGVCRWAEPRACNVSVFHVDRMADDEHELLRRINSRGIDGLIWVHPVPEQEKLLAAVARQMPCVSVGREYFDAGVNTVVPNYEQAALLFDKYLIAHGHDAYSVVGRTTVDPFSQAFVRGFNQAAALRGERFSISHYVDISPFNRERLADLLLDFHMEGRGGPDAIVATSSSYLRPLLNNDRFRRRVERKQLSLAAFDYGIYPMGLYWPGRVITHVACDWGRIGGAAMNLLVSLVRGEDHVPRAERHPVRLVEGQTVFPPTPPQEKQ